MSASSTRAPSRSSTMRRRRASRWAIVARRTRRHAFDATSRAAARVIARRATAPTAPRPTVRCRHAVARALCRARLWLRAICKRQSPRAMPRSWLRCARRCVTRTSRCAPHCRSVARRTMAPSASWRKLPLSSPTCSTVSASQHRSMIRRARLVAPHQWRHRRRRLCQLLLGATAAAPASAAPAAATGVSSTASPMATMPALSREALAKAAMDVDPRRVSASSAAVAPSQRSRIRLSTAKDAPATAAAAAPAASDEAAAPKGELMSKMQQLIHTHEETLSLLAKSTGGANTPVGGTLKRGMAGDDMLRLSTRQSFLGASALGLPGDVSAGDLTKKVRAQRRRLGLALSLRDPARGGRLSARRRRVRVGGDDERPHWHVGTRRRTDSPRCATPARRRCTRWCAPTRRRCGACRARTRSCTSGRSRTARWARS
jgi:hypothetical protein